MLCPCFKYESGLKKTDMHVVKVGNILLPHIQKSREALADARKSIRKRVENKQWTYCSSFMSKTCFILLNHFFDFLIC